jgi:Flp pilus assembly protein TadD
MKLLPVILSLAGVCIVQAGLFDSIFSFFGGANVPSRLTAAAVASVVSEAQQLIRSQDFDKAVNVLLPLIDNDPDDKDANMLLGSSFLAMERADLAETFLRHAVQLTQWQDASSISNLAEATRLNGDLSLAAKILQRGYTSLNNTDPSGQLSFEFGTLQEQMGNHTAAANWYLSSALADGSNTRAWLKASTLLFPNKNWDLEVAGNVLATAVKTKPDDAQLVFNLGVVMHYLDRVADAVTLYREALRLDPLHYATMSNLATALHSSGQAGQAQELYQKVFDATLSPVPGEIFKPFSGTATALGNYALLLSSMKKHHQAAAVATRACLLDPENSNLLSVKETCDQEAVAAAAAVADMSQRLAATAAAGDWAGGVATLAAAGPPAEDEAWWYFAKGMLHYFRYAFSIFGLLFIFYALDYTIAMTFVTRYFLTNYLFLFS